MKKLIHNQPHIIFDEDILKYGWEKAYIIGRIANIVNGDGSLPKKETLHKFIKIFPKEFFYKLLQELIDCGALVEEENE